MQPKIIAILLLAAAALRASAISITTFGTPLTENFDTLTSSGTSSTVPAGWAFLETGTGTANDGLYAAGTGSNNTGDTYSFGATSSAERAFGGLRSGTL